MADGDANGVQDKTAPSLNDQIVRQIEVIEAYGRKPSHPSRGRCSWSHFRLWCWNVIRAGY
jgi:hypothetical protein